MGLAGPVALCMSFLVTVSAYAVQLVPVGTAVGIEVAVDGVLVSELSTVETASGAVSPAARAKLAAGDVITAVDGQPVENLQEFAAMSGKFDGSPVRLTLVRGKDTLDCKVTPVKSTEGKYQLGLWLRDTVAGVGTVTYADPKTGRYGALGHGINDQTSGALIPISGGEIFDASIVHVVQGESGNPGELNGAFDRAQICGTVYGNTVYGIFGQSRDGESFRGRPMETAAPGEVKTGPATILSTVAGSAPKTYDVRIDRIQRVGGEERYQLTVTDPALLAQTGGVVCGMSGSPILQNGKLVGAVTHVLVNDPTKGYGIFIENMLDAAG